MQPHIVQVHDWHAAAVPLIYWEAYHGDGLWRPRMVLTIHNLDNTGVTGGVIAGVGGGVMGEHLHGRGSSQQAETWEGMWKECVHQHNLFSHL